MTSTDPTFLRRLESDRSDISSTLDRLLPAVAEPPSTLHAAVRHAALAPGKRVRGLLTLSTASGFGGNRDSALVAAGAIEMMHTASLVLDDLPSMDDAVLRRGQPVTHAVYGESTAILAAIGLLNNAYAVVAGLDAIAAPARVQMVLTLAASVGLPGLTGGQFDDVSEARGSATMDKLRHLYARKTGALFAAAIELGALVAGASAHDIATLREFGLKVGVAFQIYDDFLDVTATSDRAGKDVGKDAGKPTMISLLGREAAQDAAKAELAAAIESIASRRACEDLLRFTRFLEALLTQQPAFAHAFKPDQAGMASARSGA